MTQAVRRGHLALVPEYSDGGGHDVWFCSHCGARPELSEPPASDARVCTRCGLGLLLEAAAHTAPQAGDPFLVLDHSLAVCAVSRSAEELLDTTETAAVNRHVAELLVPADSEAQAGANLAAAVTAATRGQEPRAVFVRPANLFGVRLRARIVPCGPAAAALVAFDRPGR